jgi:hypothetical protein
MDQCYFYVLSTNSINYIFKEKNSISLKYLERITEGIGYSKLKEKIIKEAKNN